MPADLVHGIADLPQRTPAHGFHHHCEDVAVVDHGLTQSGQAGLGVAGIALLEIRQPLELRLLLAFGGARQFDLAGDARAVRIEEGIDADDGVVSCRRCYRCNLSFQGAPRL